MIILKHKRVHHVTHSAGYIETVCKYADSGDLILVEPTANLHDLVQASDFVIAAPFSSPVYLGSAIGKDAVWYDPTSTLDWKLETQEVPLIQGYGALVEKLQKIFN